MSHSLPLTPPTTLNPATLPVIHPAIHPAILAKELNKTFDKTNSVNDLTFTIQQGESVAFLGPNGAGKSTTIKMISGILTPTSGTATLLGYPAGSLQANQNIGVVFGTRSQLYQHMTVNQCLDLSAEIYFVTGNLKLQRIQELAHSFQIEHLLKRRVRTLSLGERMRCEVVTALLHRPKILLADEPTIGLDVIAKHQLRSTLLQWQKNENTTLMLTSHDLSDVEALCSRCILINHGKKIYDGPLQDLKGPLKAIRKIKIITEDSTESIELQINLETESLPATISRLAEQYKDSLLDITISEVSLEEVLTLTYGQTT